MRTHRHSLALLLLCLWTSVPAPAQNFWHRKNVSSAIAHPVAVNLSESIFAGVWDIRFFKLIVKGLKILFLAAAFLVLSLSTTIANDYYVNATSGSNTTGNGSQASPWRTITYALSQITGTGHTVSVAAGTYNSTLGETFPILMKNGVSLVGAGMDVSIIDAGGTNSVIRCISIVDASTKVEGFTIKGGSSSLGGGFYLSAGSVLLITNNKITGNSGAGIYAENSSPLIKGNQITDNTYSDGVNVTGSTSAPRILNNVIVKNSYGINCSGSSHPRIINNTISDNVYGINISSAQPDSIINNIISFNSGFSSGYGIYEAGTTSDPGKVWYNLFYANTSGLYRDEGTTDYYTASSLNASVPECKNNIEGDPLFVDRFNGNYHERAGSPAVDAGDPSFDFSNEPSPNGSRINIGAYGNTSQAATSSPGTAMPNSLFVDASSGNNTTGDGSQTKPWKTITYALNQVSGTGKTVYVAAGAYNAVLGEAFPILMKNGVSLVGAGIDKSILDANNTETVIKCISIVDTSTRIEGFTITRGTYPGVAGIHITAGSAVKVTSNKIILSGGNTAFNFWRGGISVENSSPQITDNIISGNSGSGVDIEDSSPTVKNNLITENSGNSYKGGGLTIGGSSSRPTIMNNLIAKNTSEGVRCNSSSKPQIVNNTISDNSGAGIQIGGFAEGGASPSVTNNILAYNSGYGIYEYSSSGDPEKVWYNLFYANSSGLYRDEGSTDYYTAGTMNASVPECKNNIEGDPLFVDKANGDYHLRSSSPAIDAGDPNSPFDPDGTRADIGTFPYLKIAPTAPTLSSPSNGATSQSTTLTLSWSASTGAVTYRLQVSTNSVFTTTAFDDSTITSTSRQVGPLANNTTYYWRVNAKNAGGTSTYSSIFSFTTSVATAAPTVTTNAAVSVTSTSATLNGSVNPNGTATTAYFEWGTSNTLATSSATTSQSIGSGTSAVSVTANLTGLILSTTYYCRVVGQNSAGVTRGSIVSFTTTAAVAKTLYVSPSGNDANPGTITAPFKSIQTALKNASAGDSIKVAAGVYAENLTTQARVTLWGGYDASFAESARNIYKNKATVKPTSGTALTDASGCAIDGFVLEGGGGAAKGIVVAGGTARVTHNIVQGYSASGGTGIEVASGAAAIIKNNTVANNHLAGGGVIFYAFLVIGNLNGGTVVINNIAYNNDLGIYVNPAGVEKGYNCSFSNKFGNFAGTNGSQRSTEIAKDPRFVYPGANDFRLKASSPCIDSGDPRDAVGDEPKPNGNVIDIGAYGGTATATSVTQNVPTYVSVLGNDLNAGTIAAPLKTIQAALISALGDTIKVAGGTYNEGLLIPAYSVLLGGYSQTFAEDQRNIFLRKSTLLGVSPTMVYDRFGSVIDGFFLDGNASSEKGFDAANGTTITHNVIINVTGGFGFAVQASGPVSVINNTIRKNTRGVALELGATGSVVKNNIFAENSFAITNSAANGIARYNDFFRNGSNYVGSFTTPGIGDLNVDPQFKDAAANDFRLARGSLCIDAGDPADPVGDEPAPNGGRIDMGAYGGTKNAGVPTSDTYEPNDTADKAASIAYSFKSQGTELNPKGDVDYFKFSASVGDFVEIQVATDEASGLDVRVTLYDQAGTELVNNDNVSTGIERILYGFNKQGIYYIRIAEAANAEHFPNRTFGKDSGLRASRQVSPTGAYTLTLALGSPLPPILLIAGSGFDHLVPLRWNPPASNSPIGYKIYRSISQTASGSLIGVSFREDYVDTTAVSGVSYFYRVTSVYAATDKESAASNTSSAIPASGGFRLKSKFSTVKPTLDGVIQAAEWSDAVTEDITIRRGANPPGGVTVFYKNDDRFLYLAVDDSNGTTNTYNNLVLAFDRDNNNTWDATSPSSEGIIVIDDSSGVALVRFFGVTGSYPGFDIDPQVRNPSAVQARLSYARGHIQYELTLDLSRLNPVAAQGGTIGVFLATVSNDPSGEYPFGALVFAPLTFADLSVAKAASVPTAPALASPANGAANQPTTLTLSWNPSTDATSYRLQVSTTSSFATTFVDDSTITTTSRQIGPLANNTTYFWRVNAKNAAGTSSFSSTFSFTTVPAAPSAPTLSLPANGAVNQPTTLTFSWGASSGAISYRLQVSTSSAFTATIFDDSSITTTSRQLGPLANNTTHYWRVNAKNAGGTSAYSNTFSFTTVVAAPAIPTLSSPANGATNQPTTLTLSWTASSGATSYRLQVSTGANFTTTALDDSAITTTSRQVGPLANNTTYYWRVSAKNAGGTSAYSATTNFVTIATMTVSTPSPISFPANPTASTDYRLFSIPGGSALTVSDLLSGSQKIDWRIYRDNGASTNYLVELAATSTLTPGEGYWLLKKGPFSISSRNVQAVALSSDATYSIPLNVSGWTIVGNPFDKSVSWAAVLAANGITTSATELLRDYNGTYTSTTTMDPYKGHYYFNSSSRTSLKIPYPFSGRIDVFNPPPVDWQLQLKFSSDINEDSENYIGISTAAADEFDALESYKPPLFLDQGFLYFSRPAWNKQYSKYSSDYRPSLGEGQVWEFEVSNPRMSKATIRVEGMEQLPAGLMVTLIDPTNSEPIDLRTKSEYSYQTTSEKMAFRLIVGKQEFVQKEIAATIPEEFELTQNYPNPFNPSTAIRFKLPRAASVKIDVVSLLGQHVKTLVEGSRGAGTHTVIWDAKNENNESVATGVYLYRLFVDGSLLKTKRMILQK